MAVTTGRRGALQAIGLGMAGGLAVAGGTLGAAQAATPDASAPTSGTHLAELMAKLAAAPRRRDFKSVPMILTEPDQWDHEALTLVMGYRPAPKQAWDFIDIAGKSLTMMRNAMNSQNWAFRHRDFLLVAVTHGSAHLGLLDQSAWDKYQLAKFAGEKFKTNTLIVEQSGAAADPADFENPTGVFSAANNSIPALMRRGALFMSCHNTMWDLAEALLAAGVNPDSMSQAELTADLTNHLIPGAILTPGAAGTLPQLQQVGFHYIK